MLTKKHLISLTTHNCLATAYTSDSTQQSTTMHDTNVFIVLYCTWLCQAGRKLYSVTHWCCVVRVGLTGAARSKPIGSQTKLGHKCDLWAASVDLWTGTVSRHLIGGCCRRLQKCALQATTFCSLVLPSVCPSVCLSVSLFVWLLWWGCWFICWNCFCKLVSK